MEIKDSSAIAEKWARVTPARSADYEDGVKSPKRDWKTAAVAAESSFKQGVTKAASEGRFGKGVAKAGTDKWQSKTLEKGTARWGPGVSVAQSDYETGFAPFRSVLASTTLPNRYPRGDPRNIERVSAVAKALHAKKVSG
jgi:hypothetical protein